jgi:putative phosphoesterase
MKIGVLSDTHARRFEEIPETIVNGLADVDLIVHAGDFVAQPVLDGLRGIAEVKAVQGNMDTGALKDSLPEVMNFTAENKKLCVTHGWGAPQGIVERVMRKCKGADVIIFGHSHEPYNRYHGDVLLFNPGKAVNSYGILVIAQEVSARIIEL